MQLTQKHIDTINETNSVVKELSGRQEQFEDRLLGNKLKGIDGLVDQVQQNAENIHKINKRQKNYLRNLIGTGGVSFGAGTAVSGKITALIGKIASMIGFG